MAPEYSEKELVDGCLNGNQMCQRQLYKRYAAKMLGVCRRYANSLEAAEDILQEGFITVFSKLRQFRMEGSLEGWIRRIMVSRAIESYRQEVRIFPITDIEGMEDEIPSPDNVLSNIDAKELMQMLNELPPMYKIVFNLYIMEDMSHNEIAEKLKIPVGTSKSTLFYARLMLRKKIKLSMMVAKTIEYHESRLREY